jgi:N-acyl-L-homoserine lactone synthetase
MKDGPALLKVDAFAEQILSRVSPLALGVARTAAELEAVYGLRYAVVMDQDWARPEDLPDGQERDAFDDRAIQIVAWDDGKLVGTTRLVAPAPGYRLPVEQAFDLQMGDRGRVIDMGRTCRVPGHKDVGHRIMWGLLAKSWIELRCRGFAEVCGIFSPGMMRFYQRLGFRVEVLGEARVHWGELRYPVLVRPAEFVELLG